MKLEKCNQCHLACFNRTSDGKCKILHDTDFNKKCPFAKSLDDLCKELFDKWYKEDRYFMSINTYIDMLSDVYDIYTFKDIKRVLLALYKDFKDEV